MCMCVLHNHLILEICLSIESTRESTRESTGSFLCSNGHQVSRSRLFMNVGLEWYDT